MGANDKLAATFHPDEPPKKKLYNDPPERRGQAKRDGYRDPYGFGRPVEQGERTYSVVGPDDCDHAMTCEFIAHRGVLPCSCDATRKRFEESGWWEGWLRWSEYRVRPERVKWPVPGPDGDPWIPGVDFNDTEGVDSFYSDRGPKGKAEASGQFE